MADKSLTPLSPGGKMHALTGRRGISPVPSLFRGIALAPHYNKRLTTDPYEKIPDGFRQSMDRSDRVVDSPDARGLGPQAAARVKSPTRDLSPRSFMIRQAKPSIRHI